MKKKAYALWILLAEGVGALAGWLTRKGIRLFNLQTAKPPLTPPPIVFPIAWGILYALMGIGAARVYLAPESEARSRGLGLFAIQLAVNFLWTIVFFNVRAYGAAFFILLALWALILAMIFAFRRTDALAGWLQVPYLLWVTFAAYLNLSVWRLNG